MPQFVSEKIVAPNEQHIMRVTEWIDRLDVSEIRERLLALGFTENGAFLTYCAAKTNLIMSQKDL